MSRSRSIGLPCRLPRIAHHPQTPVLASSQPRSAQRRPFAPSVVDQFSGATQSSGIDVPCMPVSRPSSHSTQSMRLGGREGAPSGIGMATGPAVAQNRPGRRKSSSFRISSKPRVLSVAIPTNAKSLVSAQRPGALSIGIGAVEQAAAKEARSNGPTRRASLCIVDSLQSPPCRSPLPTPELHRSDGSWDLRVESNDATGGAPVVGLAPGSSARLRTRARWPS